jgi:phosphoribosylglycinamide formyltransferase-1
MKKIAVFASGTGSNFEAIYERMENEKWNAEIALVVSDKPSAKVLEKAEKRGVPTYTFQPKSFADKAEFESAILEQLKLRQVEWIILAGYMRLIGSTLLDAYPQKIVNIHPSLLPVFPGKDAIGQALSQGVKVTGITVHYVDAGMDTGPIIAQRALSIEEGVTREQLESDMHELEHQLYPEVIKKLLLLN